MDLMQKAREIAASVAEAKGYHVRADTFRNGGADQWHEVQSAHIALQQGEKLAEVLREVRDNNRKGVTGEHARKAWVRANERLAEWEAGK